MRLHLPLLLLVAALLQRTDAALFSRVPLLSRIRAPLATISAAAPTVGVPPSAGAVVATASNNPVMQKGTPKDEESAPRKADLDDWITLWRLSKPDLPLIAVAFVALLLAAAGEVATPALTSTTLNLALSGGAQKLGAPITRLTVVGVLTAVATGLRGFVFWILGSRLVARLREALYASMLAKPQAFHDQRAPGELGSRLSSDVIKLGDVLSLNINIVLRQIVQTVGGMAFVWRLHWSLAAVLAVGVLARSAFSAFYGGISRRISDAQQDALADSSAVALQGLTLVQTVRAYGTQEHESRRYGREVRTLLGLQNRQGAWYGVSRVVTGALNAALLCSTLGLGAALVSRGKLPLDALTALVLYTGFVSSASSDIGDQWARVQEALGSATKVFELVDGPPPMPRKAPARGAAKGEKEEESIPPEAHLSPPLSAGPEAWEVDETPPAPSPPRGNLVLDGVSFRYPSRTEAHVLNNVSLTVRPGELVAVIGGSGSGKSTLLKLALRFYEPQGGTITLDGADIASMPEDELRGKVTWLPQEPPLFPVTLRENIAYGAGDDVPFEAIMDAAKAANCHGFIKALPEGYQTKVAASGGSLSGGQRQRVAIARALLRDPAVLMLDEPTSALDPTSAELVEEALRSASEERSVVLITHKIAQAAMCDRILVLEQGRLVEEGTHAELVKKGGRYYEMLQQGTGGGSGAEATASAA